MAIKFNEINIPAFVLVNDLKVSILPTIRPDLLKVKGRAGSFDFGSNIEERMIEIDITIEAATRLELRQRIRELAQWLHYEDTKPLVILDEPDKYYLAKVSGDTDLSEIITIGQGSISFVCSDPYLYGEQKEISFSPTTTEPVTVTNTGGEVTYPKLDLYISQPTTNLSIIGDNQRMDFGTPTRVGETESAPKRNLIWSTDGSSVAEWTAGTAVENGDVAGKLISNGEVIYQELHNFGTGTNWHGGTLVRSLGKLVQDFTIESHLTINSFGADQIGRIEIYLRDVNGSIIGCVALCDFNLGMESPHLQARAGDLFTGNYFVNTDFYPGKYKDFDGKITFQRIGQWWHVSIVRGGNGIYWDRWETYWFDRNDSYMDEVASIQIHIGTFGPNTPVSFIHFSDITVWEENYVDPLTQVPEILIPGDHLEIDCSTGTILKNGDPFFYELNPTSSFIQLQKGANQIAVAPAVLSSGTIRFKERWL